MGLLRVMMPPKFQLVALLAFAVAMFFLENQIQKLEESRGKLGELELLQVGRLHAQLEADYQNRPPLSLFFFFFDGTVFQKPPNTHGVIQTISFSHDLSDAPRRMSVYYQCRQCIDLSAGSMKFITGSTRCSCSEPDAGLACFIINSSFISGLNW